MVMRILGIDPGSRVTGFGIIETDRGRARYITSGCVRISSDNWSERLKIIFQSITEIMEEHQPEVVAIESVFMHRNADSALKLGQARGAAICAVVTQDVPVHEYTPAAIKQSIVGKGNAAKVQVQHMVRALLNLAGNPQADAADALAIALCHSHHHQAPVFIQRSRRR